MKFLFYFLLCEPFFVAISEVPLNVKLSNKEPNIVVGKVLRSGPLMDRLKKHIKLSRSTHRCKLCIY